MIKYFNKQQNHIIIILLGAIALTLVGIIIWLFNGWYWWLLIIGAGILSLLETSIIIMARNPSPSVRGEEEK